MEKRIIARIATFLTVVCMSLAVSGATCPWLSYSGNPLIPPLTIGLFKYCEGTRCMDLKVDLAAVIAAGVNQPPISVSSVAAEWQAQGQVSAAMFFLAFIFLFFSSAAGVWVMMGKSSGKVKLLLTTFSAVLLFIGEVIAATWTHNFWEARNGELVAFNLAPKWALEPGFSTGTSAMVLVLFCLVADVATYRAKEQTKNLWGGATAAQSHVMHHTQVVNVSAAY